MGPAVLPRASYALLALAVTAVDQASKAWASLRLAESPPLEVLPGVFRLLLIRNRGALFGLFQGLQAPLKTLLFLLLPAAVIATLGWLSWRTSARHLRAQCAFSLLVGGALGNLADRLRLGHVVDFLDFYIVTPAGSEHHWPAFNLADACICAGIGLLALDSWRCRRGPAGEGRDVPDPA